MTATLDANAEDTVRINDSTLAAVVEHGRNVALAPGEVLFREGDRVTSMYVVLEGRLQLSRGVAPDWQWIGDCGERMMLGEIGVLARSTRTATAVATRRSRLVELDADALDDLIADEPSFAMLVARRAAQVAVKARRGDTALPPVTLLVGDGVQKAVVDSLRALDMDAIVLQEAELIGLPEPDRRQQLFGAANDDLPVFVVGEPDSTALADEVDRVVIVARADREVSVDLVQLVRTRLERFLAVRVVALHDGSVNGVGALGVLGVPDVVNIVHDDRRDARRLRRILTDRVRALVLGGGGARAFAQIGALKAFEEAGFEFDLVVGSGLGAVIGAQLALGWNADEIATRNRSSWRVNGRIPTVPTIAAFSGAPVARVLRHWFGTRDIADTHVWFRPCASDLSTCSSIAPNTGPLVDWVRAACALPGLYPPHVSGGRLFVDGSVLDALPADHARALGAHTIYAIDTQPLRQHTVHAAQTDSPQGLSWFLQSIPVVGSGFPSLFAIMDHSLRASQASHQLAARGLCDLVVEPPVDRYGALDFGAFNALTEIGYLEATRRLAEHNHG